MDNGFEMEFRKGWNRDCLQWTLWNEAGNGIGAWTWYDIGNWVGLKLHGVWCVMDCKMEISNDIGNKETWGKEWNIVWN